MNPSRLLLVTIGVAVWLYSAAFAAEPSEDNVSKEAQQVETVSISLPKTPLAPFDQELLARIRGHLAALADERENGAGLERGGVDGGVSD